MFLGLANFPKANNTSSQTHLYFSQFFGDPIACDAGEANGGIERAVLDAYCWMYSSWNIPQEYKGACTGGDQVMVTRGGRKLFRGSWLMINSFLLTRCITAYVPSTIESILYILCVFVNIKRQRYAFAQDVTIHQAAFFIFLKLQPTH